MAVLSVVPPFPGRAGLRKPKDADSSRRWAGGYDSQHPNPRVTTCAPAARQADPKGIQQPVPEPARYERYGCFAQA